MTLDLSPCGLINRINAKTCNVGVIGLGYVGLTTMVAVAQAGFRVIGIDIDHDRVIKLNQGLSYISDVSDEILAPLVKSNMISATSNYAASTDCDVILVCVPTPITINKEPDMEPLSDSIDSLVGYRRLGQLIVLQSTTYPGTTREFVLPKFENTGLVVGKDFYLAFALERVDPGNVNFGVHNVPKVVGGITEQCTKIASKFLTTFVDEVLEVSSPQVAEMSKLLENTFRSVNIALVNELAMLCHQMDIDVWEVIDAAATKPFGFMPFYPGPGVGGHCIPVDPFYLAWKAQEHNFPVNFIQLAAETNDNMPYYSAGLISEALGHHKKTLTGSTILLLGVTFKADINDIRNSPAIRVLELLQEQGSKVSYQDDYVPILEIKDSVLKSLELKYATFSEYDAVVILSGHTYYDWKQVVDQANLVIDLRNVTGVLSNGRNVFKL